jgi:hypothetical protein
MALGGGGDEVEEIVRGAFLGLIPEPVDHGGLTLPG